MHHFRPETRRFKAMWTRFSGNFVAETATFGDQKMVKKRVKSTRFSSIANDEMSPNIPFSARNTAFQDLWPRFLGNVDTETATFVDQRKLKKRVKPTFREPKPQTAFPVTETRF